ncbi:MAR-binding filament-like protein 1 isoform X2 [Phoenix dactylifera]|uniref:MAR-binding filament-like protein 1 isoform X2 n=1 Tax=Phoenix dactylifera TaxID=42345 RepID=A0A8B7C7Q0_PHODC|nr:MAR-binding filament-like protein 1 isoform X2 [Phoenix dactylifera]
MGFLSESSTFSQSRLSLPFFPSGSSPSLLPCSHRKVAKKKVGVAMASPQGDTSGSSHRRTFLLVGVSVLPLLQLGAIAVEDLVIGNQDMQHQKALAMLHKHEHGSQIWPHVRAFDLARGKRQDKRNYKKDMVNPEVHALKEPEQEISSQGPNKLEVQELTEPEQEVSSQESNILMLQSLKKPEQEISSQEPNQSEQVHLQNAPDNSFVSLLNGLGIVGSGVLGALYATSQKEKTDMESTFESMKTKLGENEATISSLKENFGKRLLNEQEKQKKQVTRFKEEEASLLNHLASANGTIAGLRQEVQSQKQLAENLKAQIGQLEGSIAQTEADKKMLEAKLKEKMDIIDVLQDRVSLISLEINDKEKSIEDLKLSLSEKESECKNLSSIIDHTKEDLAQANSTIEQLKEEIFKTREELTSKISSIDSLSEKNHLLHTENNNYQRKFDDLIKEYNDFKSTSEKKAALDSKVLSEKDEQLHQVEEKLNLALGEASNYRSMITELSKERDDVKALLEREVNGMNKLKDEFRIAQDTLEASRLVASNLTKELEVAKKSHEELVSKVSNIQDEFHESKKLLINDLDEAKSTSKLLSDELVSIKEVLKRSEEELSVTSSELKAVMEDRERLKKELLEIYKKLETTVRELKEERKVVATLNRELEVLGKQIQRDSEARRALETDLDEATRSLDEMNKSALLLSGELENTNSRNTSLEAEEEMLVKSLTEQKNLSKEAQENIEDAQNLITRLGSEREILEKRSKRLEEELASAKGEILRLRRQISISKEAGTEHQPKTNEVASGTPFTVKKTASRRKKGGST